MSARVVGLVLTMMTAHTIGGCGGGDSNVSVQVPPSVSALASSGLKTMSSEGVQREFYLQLPSDYLPPEGSQTPSTAPKPLLVGFHGTGGSYESWFTSGSTASLVDVVGDDAIMVFPSALPQQDGINQWSFDYDFEFFADLIAFLDSQGLRYDRNRLFVTGHSSGGGFSHETACRFGDIVRGAAPSAGSLITRECVGAVAIIQVQGEFDSLVPVGIAEAGHNYWVLYNGWDSELATEGVHPTCIDHSLLPLGSADYPVQWCVHQEGSLDDFSGHRWASFTSQAIWDFFSGLPEVEPGFDPPPGGGTERVLAATDTTLTFTLRYPDDIGPVTRGSITLYPPDTVFPVFAAPAVFLNTAFAPGAVAPGSEVTYTNVPITFQVFGQNELTFPADYFLQISIYVEGGGFPIPVPGIDHNLQYPISFIDRTTPVVIDEVLDVTPVVPFF